MTAPNIEIDGSETSPALLLVHGFMSSTLQWEPNREALRERFRVVAVDLWGHGDSPAPRDSNRYTVDAYLSEFEAIRERLGIEAWFVCGQSFGAGITISLGAAWLFTLISARALHGRARARLAGPAPPLLLLACLAGL